jgi:hypothetical protein
MGSNSFISHRMFVAALNGAETSHPLTAAERGNTAGWTPARGFSMPRAAKQLAARAAQHWLDFPLARGMERRAT